jgi:hypothetical protein
MLPGLRSTQSVCGPTRNIANARARWNENLKASEKLSPPNG